MSSGPALGLGWDCEDSISCKIDDYESNRQKKKIMALPRPIREAILKRDCGYSNMEVARCVRKINAIKAKRRQTVTNLQHQKAEERMEDLKDSIMRMACKKMSDKEEMDRLWDDAAKIAASRS